VAGARGTGNNKPERLGPCFQGVFMTNVKDFKKDFENKWIAEKIIEYLAVVDRIDPAGLERILSYVEGTKDAALIDAAKGKGCEVIPFETVSSKTGPAAPGVLFAGGVYD